MSTEQPVSNCNMTRLLLHQNSLNCSWTADSGGAFFLESGFRDSFYWISHFNIVNALIQATPYMISHWLSDSLEKWRSSWGSFGKDKDQDNFIQTTWIPRPHPNLVGVCIAIVFVIGFLLDQNSGSLVLLKLDCNWTTDSGGADLVCLCSSVIG